MGPNSKIQCIYHGYRHTQRQTRSPRIPKGDINGAWQHDLFDSAKSGSGGGGKSSLGDRLSGGGGPPKVYTSLADRALREAAGEKGLAIKGASANTRGNVIEVTGLADGTTSEDVEVRYLSP